tara:strand:- start:407 stop:517 length:111 start_codon:yes stop_codon:yes gene_type:complete
MSFCLFWKKNYFTQFFLMMIIHKQRGRKKKEGEENG